MHLNDLWRCDAHHNLWRLDQPADVPDQVVVPILISGSTLKAMGTFVEIVYTIQNLTYSITSVMSWLDCPPAGVYG